MQAPVADIRGIGSFTAKALAEAGIDTVEDLADATIEQITAIRGFGKIRAKTVRKAAGALLGRKKVTEGAVSGAGKKPKKNKKKKGKRSKKADSWDSYKRRTKRRVGKLIARQKVVTIHYTLTDGHGKLIDRTGDGNALVYLYGSGGILPGLEAELEGKAVGDRLQVTIPPSKAYGPSVGSLVQSVPRDHFGKVEDLRTGMRLQTHTDAGMHTVTVVKIEGDRVTVDGNHPLAGVTLNFDVSVVDVRDATLAEIRDGRAHASEVKQED